MTTVSRNCSTITVEHIQIISNRPFAEVRTALEARLPRLDPKILVTLRSGDQDGATEYEATGPRLSILLERDHGSLLEIAGLRRNAIQYDVGNPLTASKMTRHNLGAALYAPLRVVLIEDQNGHAVFEYDRPSCFFGQFGDLRIRDVGLHLDDILDELLLAAAS